MRDRELLRAQTSQLAHRQLGHVTRVQLLGLGASSTWIRSQMRVGHLIPVHAGVYALGHVPRHAHARAMAAVLACGDAAALSHVAAAALWGIARWPGTLEVTVATERRRPGIWTHRSTELDPRDVRTHHGVRVTAPVRTLLDLAPRLADAGLLRAINDLRVAGQLRSGALAELAERSPRSGRLLGEAGSRPTRSPLEDRFRRFAAHHRLPMPECNAVLPENGREVDALYRGARLIVELDSWRFHSDRASFERDRRTDAAALALGYRTLRVTDDRIGGDGDAEARTIRRILTSSR